MGKLNEIQAARDDARAMVQAAKAQIRHCQDARLAAMAGLVEAQDKLQRAAKTLTALTAELTALLHADTSGVIGSKSEAPGSELGPVEVEERNGAVL